MKDAKGHGSEAHGAASGYVPLRMHGLHDVPMAVVMSRLSREAYANAQTKVAAGQMGEAFAEFGGRRQNGPGVLQIASQHGIPTKHLASDPVHRTSPIDGQYFKRG